MPPLRQLLITAATALATLCGFGQDAPIVDEVSLPSPGVLRLAGNGDPSRYYILWSGSRPDTLDTPSDMTLGVVNPRFELTVDFGDADRGFAQAQRVSIDTPRDTDRDGIDDVYELVNEGILNPLDPADAGLDPDGNQRTHFEEYLVFLGDPGGIASTSPIAGETGVAVTRESVLRLERPLAQGTVILSDRLRATLGQQVIPAHVHLSDDRRRLTLFYQQPLPPQSRVTVSFATAGLTDYLGLGVDGNGDGIPGGVFQFAFETLALTEIPGTAVCGRVFASELGEGPNGEPLNTPLEGVKITVDGRENQLFTFTDAMGNFRLDPAPAGRFFVHIDGATAVGAPPGGYYPTVGKAWEARAGIETNVGNIHLPLVAAGTLQPSSATEPTEIGFPPSVLAQFPEFSTVKITVPPNALLRSDGTRGGSIGIAPVPPDRLPGTLPPGLNFPLVITVQTDGAGNFDQPVPVCFPNLPDPVTGVTLAPGEPAILYSFDHDTGKWAAVGTGTVNEDGTLICSDPGSGIVAPGWHAFIRCVKLYRQAGHNILVSILAARELGCDPPPLPRPREGCDRGSDRCVADCRDAFNAKFDNILATYTALLDNCELQFPDIDGEASPGFIPCVIRSGDKFSKSAEAAASQSAACLDACVNNCLPVVGPDCSDGVLACIQGCERWRDARLALLDQVLQAQLLACESIRLWVDSDGVECREAAMQKHEAGRQSIFDLTTICINACSNCEDPGDGPAPAKAPPSPGDPPPQRGQAPPPPSETPLEAVRRLLSERFAIFAEISADPSAPDFEARRDEADALLEEANEIAGGDALAFLDQHTIFEEERLIEDGVWHSEGNPPESPLLFVAELVGAAGPYVLRGETGPFGQHEITVPDVDRLLSVTYYDPPTRRVAIVLPFRSPVYETILPEIVLLPLGPDDPDRDVDGLPDVVEPVYGTDPDNPDTDGDGIVDGGEIDLGTNPLDGLPAVTGLLAAVDIPGQALDIWANNNLAAIAADTGLSVFNIFNGMEPVLVAQIDIPGSAHRVAADGDLLAVAAGPAGLVIVDPRLPTESAIIHQIPLPSDAIAVAVQDGVAFAGLSDGRIAVIEMARGLLLDYLESVGAAVQDVLANDAHLYALTTDAVHTFAPFTSPAALATVSSPRSGPQNFRLAPGGGILYAIHGRGYNVFDLADPANPPRIATSNAVERGWRDLADGGSGLGVATVGPDAPFLGVGDHHVRTYDLTDPAVTDVHLATFETPDDSLTVTIHNGIAYAVDYQRGLRVVNYLPFDSQGMPPALTVSANFDIHNQPNVELGARAVVRAVLDDDIHVRNVEFSLDGQRVWTDAAFPFEFRFTVPPPSAAGEPLRLDVVASDTGGNRTSQSFDIDVLPDITAPSILSFSPPDGSLRGTSTSVLAHFSEAIDLASASPAFSLADGLGGAVAVATTSLEGGTTLAFTPLAPLAPGSYSATLSTSLADLAGNGLDAPLTWSFEVFDIANDSDGDCLPDDVELALGLDPLLADSDNNGTLDGDEDSDGDGLINCREILLGTDPGSPDSDADFLPDGAEVAAGTDPLDPDSDGDGFLDGEEDEFGSDPTQSSSVPAETTGGYSEVALPPFSTLNEAPPSLVPYSTAVAPVVGVENQHEPDPPPP